MGEKKFRLSANIIMALVMVILLASSLYVIFIYFAAAKPLEQNAKENGTIVGENLGNLVGTAIGSKNGIIKGIPEGLEDGKAEGLKAKDTKISIHERVRSIGKLEVLQASVSLVNEHSIGEKYKKLEIVYANAVFTVDLEKAMIEQDEEEIRIILPAPELSLKIDDTKTEKIAEYEKMFLNGSAEDGFAAAMNSMKEITENAEQYMSNYDSLMEQARRSAKNNLQLLAEQMSVDGKTVIVEFEDEGGVS